MSQGKVARAWLQEQARRRMRLRRAKEALGAVGRWLDQIAAEAGDARGVYGDMVELVDVPAISDSGDVDELERRATELRHRAIEAEAKLRRQVLASSRNALLIDVDLGDAEKESRSALEVLGLGRKRRAEPAPSKTRPVSEAVARLSEEASAEDLDTVRSLAREVSQAKTAAARKARFLELEGAIGSINKSASRKARAREQADSLRGQLFGLEHPAVDAVLEELESVRQGEAGMTNELRRRVAVAREAAEASQADRYIAESVAEAFRDRGYEVDDEFVGSMVAEEPAYADQPRLPDHSVRVSLEEGRVEFQVVRRQHEGEPASFDRRAQRQFCEDFPEILDAVRARSIEAELIEDVPPGVIKSAYVPRRPIRTRRRRHGDELKQREMGRPS